MTELSRSREGERPGGGSESKGEEGRGLSGGSRGPGLRDGRGRHAQWLAEIVLQDIFKHCTNTV